MRSLRCGLICGLLLFTVCSILSAAQTSAITIAGSPSNIGGRIAPLAASSNPTNVVDHQTAALPSGEAERAEFPESPGALQFNAQTHSGSLLSLLPISQAAQTPSNTEAAPAQNQSTATNSNSNPQQPVGTAAAPAPVVTGTAAARPAGVAVAPAKQHRVRTIVIRVGAIAGAAVALGTVVALTEATGSRPPGAH